MGLFGSKEEKAIATGVFQTLQEIGQINKNTTINILLYEDHLVFRLLKKAQVRMEYSQIKEVSYYSEKEVTEMAKSNAGRAVVGGLLFGPLGAIAGASGKKTKKETKYRGFLSIRYESSSGEEKQLDFSEVEILGGTINSERSFAKKLKKLAGLDKEVTHL